MQNADQSADVNSRHVAVAVARRVASRRVPAKFGLSAPDTGRILIHALFMPCRANEIAEVDLHERGASGSGRPCEIRGSSKAATRAGERGRENLAE